MLNPSGIAAKSSNRGRVFSKHLGVSVDLKWKQTPVIAGSRLSLAGAPFRIKGNTIAVMACFCGKKFVADLNSVRKKTTVSCGCARKAPRTHGHCSVGLESKEYKIWSGMKARCYSVNRKAYKDYGGRGISVCDRWVNSFENFLSDMGKRPTDNHTIERLDNDGNYEPSNCCWATRKDQQKNRRVSRRLTAFGETKNITEWFNDPRCVVSPVSVYSRLNSGMSAEEALSLPRKRCGLTHELRNRRTANE